MQNGTNETRTVLDELRESRREIEVEIREEENRLDELRARSCDLRAEEYRVEGYPYDEEAARAEARWHRDPTPENGQAMHIAHVRASAAYHLRAGIVPADNHVWRQEVEEEMDRQRAETLEVPRALSDEIRDVIRSRGPSTGLDVQDATGVGSGVYPLLRAMERDGVLRSWEEPGPPERGGRPRRFYDLAERAGVRQ